MKTLTITKEVYTFEELDESAKEHAREWWREGALQYDWWEFVYDDFERICEILGVEIANNPKNWNNGKGKQIYFTGFWSQCDGASFAGSYRYKKGSCKAIREEYAPLDEELHRIADTLRDIQRIAFYNAIVSITQSGHYVHSNTMSFVVESYDDWTFPWSYEFCDKIAEEFEEPLRDLANWLYRALEKECDYLLSDESVDESITINEYEFTVDGRIA